MPTERYLQLRQEGVKDMHNNELLRACREDNQLLDDFLKENKDFVFSTIIKYKGNIDDLRKKFRIEEEELLQNANIGVITALRDFDFDRGIKFTTFAVRPILWEINQLLYNDAWLVKVSRGSVDILGRIKEIEDTLGYLPPDEEIAQILKVPVDRIQDINRFTGDIDRIDGMENFEVCDMAREDEDEIVNRVYVEQMLEDACLDEREKEIIDLLVEGLNNSQIAERLKVYPMTINRSINRIRNKIENANFEDRRISKYEQEIQLVAEEIIELGYLIDIDDMKDLLEVCGFDTSDFTQRILYYIRQKAVQRTELELEDAVS
ncbi:sigma-70 family RNA polymerase sigma factor (plasmid) [Paenibacillus peoriae]|uniref:Sigma-70 family RNA polymerase sigma factor n=1 Tax=Paenibacillus peoriae TaxID=59893 RepID=A0A7H0YH37_9BACL|nr:sigma-70 family RNA polymerase sigma factor [Paenibacillus peoriae]QNR70395.1 sigma-70 family RNA polymerase sigma factor [Paenibacillus peoriae]